MTHTIKTINVQFANLIIRMLICFKAIVFQHKAIYRIEQFTQMLVYMTNQRTSVYTLQYYHYNKIKQHQIKNSLLIRIQRCKRLTKLVFFITFKAKSGYGQNFNNLKLHVIKDI